MLTPVSQKDEPRRAFRFGDFVLDLDRESLSRNGRELRLRPKSLAVLAHLVRHSGRLVTKEELLDAIWGHRHVTEGSLTQCLVDIRRVLGDESHEMVRTVPRRGFIFESEVTAGPVVTDQVAVNLRPRRRRRAVVGAVAVVLVIFGAWWGARHLGHNASLPDSAAHSALSNSIAVLPFADMSKSGNNAYFADGLTEEVLDSLTQIPGLKVIARTSSFAFKGRNVDIPTVANRLNVAYVMEGSVRKSGNMVRITVQLVDARTDSHLWSRTFDRELGDVFSVQSEIARLVSESLKVSQSRAGGLKVVRRANPQANEHYMRGNFFWQRRASGDRDLAEREFRKAVDLDPGFARAWVALAGAYYARNWVEQPESGWLSRYKDMLERALAADPDLAEAHARLTHYFIAVGDRKSAEEQWAMAQTLEPDNVLVLGMGAGWALWRGLYEEAVSLQRRAAEVDPLSSLVHANLASYLLAAGRYREAASELQQSLELSPDDEKPDLQRRTRADDMVLTRIIQHRYDEALAMLAGQAERPIRDENLALANWGLGRKVEYKHAVERMSREGGWQAEFRMAELSAFRGESDKAFEHLRIVNVGFGSDAIDLKRDIYLTSLRLSPLFIPLRNDPRWKQLWYKWRKWM